MKVFVTGGTGTIGAPVVAELVAHDHEVAVLARSDASAAAIRAAGATPVPGSITDLDVLAEAARAADGVVSLAFPGAYGSADALAAAIAEEAAAVGALGDALAASGSASGPGKAFVAVSGTPWVPGRASTENDPLPMEGPVAGRAQTVTRMLALAERGVRTSAVRMPRTVHRDGQGGFAGLLTGMAREAGVVAYPGDGAQRWPAVHALDAAVLFRLALESAPAGSAWHAVADEGDAVRDIATVIGRRLGLPVESRAVETFGPFGAIFAMDQPASSAVTRAELGWTPQHPSLLEDLELLQP